MTEFRWMIVKLIQSVVLTTLVLQYFFHSYFLWWLHFFVSCISLRVLCCCFIHSDEMFPATYPSVPWYASLLKWEWLQNFIQCMLFYDMFCNGVSILLSSGVINCCTLVLHYFFHSYFLWWLHFFVSCISLRILCCCFIYAGEMFPATYPSVP